MKFLKTNVILTSPTSARVLSQRFLNLFLTKHIMKENQSANSYRGSPSIIFCYHLPEELLDHDVIRRNAFLILIHLWIVFIVIILLQKFTIWYVGVSLTYNYRPSVFIGPVVKGYFAWAGASFFLSD